MESPSIACLLLFIALVVTTLLGRRIRRYLPDEHVNTESRDTVKLAMGLIATMTALLLGLLVSSAKGTYDTRRAELIQMSAKVMFLNRVLVAYGPEANTVRAEIHQGITDTVQSLWPEKKGGQKALDISLAEGISVYAAIQKLTPRDDTQRGLKAEAAGLAMDLEQLHFLMLAQAVPAIPGPLMIMVSCWLVIIFLFFSLLSPPNRTAILSLPAAAISVVGAMFLILELDQPFAGPIQLSSAPVISALEQLAK